MKILAKLFGTKQRKNVDPLYDFIAGPPTKEKEAMLREVARKAGKDQQDLIERSRQIEITQSRS